MYSTIELEEAVEVANQPL